MSILMALQLVALALVLSVAAGAAAGISLGGRDLGRNLAAMMGVFYGPTAVLPAAVLGLGVLAFVK